MCCRFFRLGRKIGYLAAWLFILLAGCRQTEWDEYTRLPDGALDETLAGVLAQRPDLSRFLELLEEAGYDSVLNATKSYTVWAPDNQALERLDPQVHDNPAQLRRFLAHHLAGQAHFTREAGPSGRVEMLSGKYLGFNGTSKELDDVPLKEADIYCKNGVLHVLQDALEPRASIWEMVTGMLDEGDYPQIAFLRSLNRTVFVDSLADQTGVDPVTGLPVYDTLSGQVLVNDYLNQAAALNREDTLYTFFVLSGEAYEAELDRFRPYYRDSLPGTSDSLLNWYVAKDLVFKGQYTREQLPGMLYSTDSVRVPVDKGAITGEYRASNGMVYVLNSCPVSLEDKIQTVIAEGEHPSGFSHDRRANVFYRHRSWASDGMDILSTGHSQSEFNIRYTLEKLPSVTYRIYWRVGNDFRTQGFDQRLAVDSLRASYFTEYHWTEPGTYDEVLIGEYTKEQFGRLNLFLVSYPTSNNTWNPLALDYIRLEPVFE